MNDTKIKSSPRYQFSFLDQCLSLDLRSGDAAIIELCVRWYITYRLSYRDLQAMMAERGIVVSHSTILRWVSRWQ